VFNELVDEITHIVVAIADEVMVGIRMLINGVEKVFKAIITVIDDIASAVGSFFRMLAKIVEDVIAALSVFFHFDRILAVQRFLAKRINDGLAQDGSGKSKVGVAINQQVQPLFNSLISGGEQAVKNAFDPVIAKLAPGERPGNMPGSGATPHSVYLAKRGGIGPDSGGATHTVQCGWGLQKMKSGLPSASMGAVAAVADDPLTRFWKAFESSLSTDPILKQAFGELTAQIDATFHVSSAGDFFRGLLADLLRLLEALTILALAISKAFFDGLFALIEGLISAVSAVLNYALDIPVLSWLFGWLTGGEKLTLLNLITLVGAIPVTMLYRIVTGTWPSVGQASDDSASVWTFYAFTISGVDSVVIGIFSGLIDGAGTNSTIVDDPIFRGVLIAATWVRVVVTFPYGLQSEPSPLDWAIWGSRVASAIVPMIARLEPARSYPTAVCLAALACSAVAIACLAAAYHKGDPTPIRKVGLSAGLFVSFPGALNWIKLFGEEAAFAVGVLDVVMGFAVCGLDFVLAWPNSASAVPEP